MNRRSRGGLIKRWFNPRKNAASIASVIRVQRCDYAVVQFGRVVVLVRREYLPVVAPDGSVVSR